MYYVINKNINKVVKVGTFAECYYVVAESWKWHYTKDFTISWTEAWVSDKCSIEVYKDYTFGKIDA